MKNRIILGVAMIAAIALTGGAAAPALAADAPPNPPSKPGYTLDWAEEFDGPGLDTTTWMPYYLPHFADVREDARGRYTIANGMLTQRVDQDQKPWAPTRDGTVRSSALQTYNADWWHKFNANATLARSEPTFDGYQVKYGYIELRAKLSTVGGGGHQALWLVGTEDRSSGSRNPEIDMLESFFSHGNTWQIASHSWGSPDFNPADRSCVCAVPGTPKGEFHNYGMEWTPTELKFYFDGTLIKTIADAPNQSMGIILNIYTDAGSGQHNDVWPKSWQVDYLRVFKKTGGYYEYETLKDRQNGRLLNVENRTGQVESSAVPATAWSAHWIQERTADGFVRFKNRWTGAYMHTEGATGVVQAGTAQSGWWSAQFSKEIVDGHYRLKNREQGGYVHADGALARYGALPATAWTSQWKIDPAPVS